MTYFDVKQDTELWVDASPVGLGAMLGQPDTNGHKKVVSYASRSLSSVEQRYSQIEREMLAIVWSIQRFHIYCIHRSQATAPNISETKIHTFCKDPQVVAKDTVIRLNHSISRRKKQPSRLYVSTPGVQCRNQ